MRGLRAESSGNDKGYAAPGSAASAIALTVVRRFRYPEGQN
jgi:hypothetical protein